MKEKVQEYIPFGAIEQTLIDKLARLLGITAPNLIILQPELYADKLPDGDVEGYTVKFKQNAPQEIVDTIKSKSDNNTVKLAYYDVIM